MEGWYEWEILDFGFEVDNFKYGSVVVKVYWLMYVLFRNCMLGYDLWWFIDIFVLLVLIGLLEWFIIGENGSYVFIVDYFLVFEGDNEDVRWYFVRLYLLLGYFKNLVKWLRKFEVKYMV